MPSRPLLRIPRRPGGGLRRRGRGRDRCRCRRPCGLRRSDADVGGGIPTQSVGTSHPQPGKGLESCVMPRGAVGTRPPGPSGSARSLREAAGVDRREWRPGHDLGSGRVEKTVRTGAARGRTSRSRGQRQGHVGRCHRNARPGVRTRPRRPRARRRGGRWRGRRDRWEVTPEVRRRIIETAVELCTGRKADGLLKRSSRTVLSAMRVIAAFDRLSLQQKKMRRTPRPRRPSATGVSSRCRPTRRANF